MGGGHRLGWPPIESPVYSQRGDHWRHFDSTVDAVSFGFVATAILISMFLAMAIFERFLRLTSPAPPGRRYNGNIESQTSFGFKLRLPSPKMSVNSREVSVLMPGENIPTFIAHPAPVPCRPERILWPTHQHKSLASICETSNLNASSRSI